MRPLTDAIPKPLLQVRGKTLIEYHLEKLASAGVQTVVINTAHLAEQFSTTLGDGSRWSLRIIYSFEGATALETGGGMLHALKLFGTQAFIAINGDIFTAFDFSTLPHDPAGLAHLVMVPNPAHHPNGDFTLRNGLLHDDRQDDRKPPQEASPRLTFAGIGIYRPQLVVEQAPGTFSVVPILRAAMRKGLVSGERFDGVWSDVGTPQRLAALQ